jgi:hypothetical protein
MYKNYGARGISVSRRWQRFENWFEDFGKFKPGPRMTMDRIDNNKNYCLSNCRWATSQEQQQNKTTTTCFEYNGERMTLKAWARRFGVPANSAYYRIKRGWSFEEAMNLMPVV